MVGRFHTGLVEVGDSLELCRKPGVGQFVMIQFSMFSRRRAISLGSSAWDRVRCRCMESSAANPFLYNPRFVVLGKGITRESLVGREHRRISAPDTAPNF